MAHVSEPATASHSGRPCRAVNQTLATWDPGQFIGARNDGLGLNLALPLPPQALGRAVGLRIEIYRTVRHAVSEVLVGRLENVGVDYIEWTTST